MLVGSGHARVTSARLFRPGARVLATVRADRGRSRQESVTADGAGRVALALELGRGNTAQQYTPGARTLSHRTRVRLRAYP